MFYFVCDTVFGIASIIHSDTGQLEPPLTCFCMSLSLPWLLCIMTQPLRGWTLSPLLWGHNLEPPPKFHLCFFWLASRNQCCCIGSRMYFRFLESMGNNYIGLSYCSCGVRSHYFHYRRKNISRGLLQSYIHIYIH